MAHSVSFRERQLASVLLLRERACSEVTVMTNDERIQELKRFGYNLREAAFLILAGLHSGYFLGRQYNRFLQRKRGSILMQLVRKTDRNGHTRAMTCFKGTRLYHLGSRSFYPVIGEPDNRHRRQHSMAVVKRKLMALDFVLNLPGLTFLTTEKEKTDYFCSREGIAPLLLPRKIYRSKTSGETTTRYFVEKFPIALTGDEDGSSPVVSFGYIDACDRTTAGFTSFLGQEQEIRQLYHLWTGEGDQAVIDQLEARKPVSTNTDVP